MYMIELPSLVSSQQSDNLDTPNSPPLAWFARVILENTFHSITWLLLSFCLCLGEVCMLVSIYMCAYSFVSEGSGMCVCLWTCVWAQGRPKQTWRDKKTKSRRCLNWHSCSQVLPASAGTGSVTRWTWSGDCVGFPVSVEERGAESPSGLVRELGYSQQSGCAGWMSCWKHEGTVLSPG